MVTPEEIMFARLSGSLINVDKNVWSGEIYKQIKDNSLLTTSSSSPFILRIALKDIIILGYAEDISYVIKQGSSFFLIELIEVICSLERGELPEKYFEDAILNNATY